MNRIRYNCKPALRTGLSAVVLLLGMASCNDYLPDASAPVPPSGEEVQVELSFGFADKDDGYNVSGKADTRSGNTVQNGAFCAQLAPAALTRGEGFAVDLKPDALYSLYVLQYDASGKLLKPNSTPGSTPIGSKLTYTLAASDDCQLVVIACGEGYSLSAAISGNLSDIQKLTIPSSIFDKIPANGATQEEINKMPYMLHLEHVKVTSDGKLQSVDGAHDARLLLKRLATKLTVNWMMDYTSLDANYKLQEVKLCQVPSDFRLLPVSESTEWGTTYPSSVSEFKDTYRLTTAADLTAGTKTVWIPANVRGTSAKSTSPYYRTKDNAPTAASYVELVVDNSAKQERLYYRAYLGGNEPTDFNLYENTDYYWTLNVTSANYRSDSRIQLLDQTPVKSTNLVETSNCFMMQPGTNICFNPYKHEAGAGGMNTALNGITIDKVVLLWQNKDAGTSGDLVMGYTIADNNHTNLVNYSDLNDRDAARVHVKVPVTQGGNAVIAAYSGSTIVWSWHLWISDYVPATAKAVISDDASRKAAIDAARAATLGGTVQAYLGDAWTNPSYNYYKKVIMDRNLGAIRATYSMDNNLEAARAYGYLYQWGRKDPFPGSIDGTSNEIGVIYDGNGRGMEIKKVGKASSDMLTQLTQAIQNPISFIRSLILKSDSWGGGSAKTIYDPCPIGWRVPDFTADVAKNPFQGMAMGTNTKALVKGQWLDTKFGNTEQFYDVKNGFLYNEEVWLPIFRLREAGSGKLRDPYGNNGQFYPTLLPSFGVWSASESTLYTDCGWYMEAQREITSIPDEKVASKGYGFSVRCVQE